MKNIDKKVVDDFGEEWTNIAKMLPQKLFLTMI